MKGFHTVVREFREFRQVMTDVRAAQERIEHRLELQGVQLEETRRELAQLTIHKDRTDERLGRVEGEVRALASHRSSQVEQVHTPRVDTESEGDYQTVASSPSVSQSPELISADRPQVTGSTGMSVEVGSPTVPILPSPTSASTPAVRSMPGLSVCAPAPEVSRHRPSVCVPDGFRDSQCTRVSSTPEQVAKQAEPAELPLRCDSNRRDRTRTRFSSQSLMGKGTFGRT